MTRFFRGFRALTGTRTPMLPHASPEPPGTRLAMLRTVAQHTGWGAGIGPTAALTGAVCQREETRIATIAAPLVAVAAALAGYTVVAYGEEPPVRPVPTVPLAWGTGELSGTRHRFDAVAVDATAHPLAAAWLNEIFARIAFRGGRTHLAILCTAADATTYLRECHNATWDIHGMRTDSGELPIVLLTSARFRLLGS